MKRLLVLTLSIALCQGALAASLAEVVEAAEQAVSRDARVDADRLAAFRADAARQAELLQRALEREAAAEAEQERLQALFDKLELDIVEARESLQARSGQLGEVFGVAREQARELQGLLRDSSITAQIPERTAALAFGESQRVPTLGEMRQIWLSLLEEMAATGASQRFRAPVLQPDGSRREEQVARVGPFVTVDAAGRYLLWQAEQQELQVLSRQPGGDAQARAQQWVSGGGALPVDPSRGNLLRLQTLKPDWRQRLEQGGLVGYLILALGAFGLLVAAWRLLAGVVTDWRVSRQLRRPERPHPGNPLGRLLLTAGKDVDGSREDLELKVDQALLGEVPTLERGLSLLKLLAAVAPLLGLLGTVTGMIGTFQAITLFGAGDPKMMAGGISQALITTVLGLCVAIPLLFCHSFLHARVRRVFVLLQQRSVALLLQRRDASALPMELRRAS